MMRYACTLFLVAGSMLQAAEPSATADANERREVLALLTAHCVKCHGAEKQAGNVRLDDLAADVGKDRERWLAVRDQLRDGLMPPAKEPPLSETQGRRVVAWITAQTGDHAARLPNQGNLIPHELLFGKSAEAGGATPGRVWRLSPDGYIGFARELMRGRPAVGLVQPFTLIPDRGIKDFAGLYAIDEPSTEILVRNAEAIVETQTAHEIKDNKVVPKNDATRDFVALMDPGAAPTRRQLETAVQAQFRLAIGRAATADEVGRFVSLYDRIARTGDRPGAARTMLQAVLLRTDVLFRSERGRDWADNGRRLLAPRELARALSLTLSNRREPGIMAMQDLAESDLATREQIAVHVRRVLDDARIAKPRILQFFREYFEYDNAGEVFKEKPEDAFKDDPERFKHEPAVLIADTDQLIEHILAEDKDVFRRLLTTPESFANFAVRKSRTGQLEATRAVVPRPPAAKDKNQRPIHGPEWVYGFDIADWPAQQPAPLPKDTRLGVLMQPSWLVAFSTNFENDPVRRGRWIRERLLGGTDPDLPIGVVAQVPDEPHRTLRDRLTVTREARCWKCHQRMDELGLPFENFNHYGRFRTGERVLDVAATARNVDPKGKPLGPVHHQAELTTTGRIDDSGAAQLDGVVKDPRELVRRLADSDSDRARQVFVRHVFRFFLGRNETLSDARTLQDADRAFVASDGSFKALVAALLTSDSYLYRSHPLVSPPQAASQPEPKP